MFNLIQGGINDVLGLPTVFNRQLTKRMNGHQIGMMTVALLKGFTLTELQNTMFVDMPRLKTFTREGSGDKKRAISTGEREIICHPQAASVTKNRFNITDPLPFTFDGGNPFEQWVMK